jgi:hypothetical protein
MLYRRLKRDTCGETSLKHRCYSVLPYWILKVDGVIPTLPATPYELYEVLFPTLCHPASSVHQSHGRWKTSLETSGTVYPPTQRHIPERRIPPSHRHENLEARNFQATTVLMRYISPFEVQLSAFVYLWDSTTEHRQKNGPHSSF